MWNNVIGQEKVKEKIRSLYKAGRLSHAYLFYGSEGTGKDAIAIELAKLLNCSNVQNGDEACNKCESCRKISAFHSEYFNLICALPAGRAEETDSDPIEKLTAGDFDAYIEQLKLKSENPYHQINIPNANNIRINSIRDLASKIYLSASHGNTKVFLISQAEKMRQEAANSLLKVLEEPPAKSVLILTTSKMNALPQTIAGRCQKIHFEPLSPEQIITKLSETTSYSKKDIELASRIASGSYSRALQLLDMGIKELRDAALEYLVSILKNEYADIVLTARNVTAKNDRDRTKYFLYLLSTWFRDLLLIKYNTGNCETNTANADIIDRLKKLDSNYPNTDVYSIIMEIEEADRLITQNVQLTLILVNLSFRLKELIH
ncbi:MAG TPA: hypothetical protein VGK25_12260 [Ignavibacteria bacterium]|jgi:DNA polymerase-3 subunit delta'